jgi:hypothetical protein
MKRKEKQPLRDEEKLVSKERSAAMKDELDLFVEEMKRGSWDRTRIRSL